MSDLNSGRTMLHEVQERRDRSPHLQELARKLGSELEPRVVEHDLAPVVGSLDSLDQAGEAQTVSESVECMDSLDVSEAARFEGGEEREADLSEDFDLSVSTSPSVDTVEANRASEPAIEVSATNESVPELEAIGEAFDDDNMSTKDPLSGSSGTVPTGANELDGSSLGEVEGEALSELDTLEIQNLDGELVDVAEDGITVSDVTEPELPGPQSAEDLEAIVDTSEVDDSDQMVPSPEEMTVAEPEAELSVDEVSDGTALGDGVAEENDYKVSESLTSTGKEDLNTVSQTTIEGFESDLAEAFSEKTVEEAPFEVDAAVTEATEEGSSPLNGSAENHESEESIAVSETEKDSDDEEQASSPSLDESVAPGEDSKRKEEVSTPSDPDLSSADEDDIRGGMDALRARGLVDRIGDVVDIQRLPKSQPSRVMAKVAKTVAAETSEFVGNQSSAEDKPLEPRRASETVGNSEKPKRKKKKVTLLDSYFKGL